MNSLSTSARAIEVARGEWQIKYHSTYKGESKPTKQLAEDAFIDWLMTNAVIHTFEHKKCRCGKPAEFTVILLDCDKLNFRCSTCVQLTNRKESFL